MHDYKAQYTYKLMCTYFNDAFFVVAVSFQFEKSLLALVSRTSNVISRVTDSKRLDAAALSCAALDWPLLIKEVDVLTFR